MDDEIKEYIRQKCTSIILAINAGATITAKDCAQDIIKSLDDLDYPYKGR
jgi:hypothetical protein